MIARGGRRASGARVRPLPFNPHCVLVSPPHFALAWLLLFCRSYVYGIWDGQDMNVKAGGLSDSFKVGAACRRRAWMTFLCAAVCWRRAAKRDHSRLHVTLLATCTISPLQYNLTALPADDLANVAGEVHRMGKNKFVPQVRPRCPTRRGARSALTVGFRRRFASRPPAHLRKPWRHSSDA